MSKNKAATAPATAAATPVPRDPLGTIPDDSVPPNETPDTLRAACEAFAPRDEIQRSIEGGREISRMERDRALQRHHAVVKACLELTGMYFRGKARPDLVAPAGDLVKAGRDGDAAGAAIGACRDALYSSDLARRTRSPQTEYQRLHGKEADSAIVLELGSPPRQAEASTLRAAFAKDPADAASYLYNVASAVVRWWPKQQDPQKSSDWAHPITIAQLNSLNPRIFPKPLA